MERTVIDLTADDHEDNTHKERDNDVPPSIDLIKTSSSSFYPFYLLSTCDSSSPSRRMPYEISLQDILSGEIKAVLLMNYKYDMSWLVASCPILTVGMED
jgi:hypothetical protein